MSRTAGPSVLPRENPRAWSDKRPEVIPPGWIQDFIHRLYEEWNRQMIRVERFSKSQSELDDNPDGREQQARTLASLQRTLKEIMRTDYMNADQRCRTPAIDPKDAVAALERRLDQITERQRANGVCAQPQSGAGGVSV